MRRLQPPQIETEAQISKGELVEGLEVVASRVELRSSATLPVSSEDLCLVDDQGLALMGRLVDKGVYYVSGGVPFASSETGGPPTSLSTPECGNKSPVAWPLPDCAVLWAFDLRMLLHRSHENRSPETPYRLQRAIEALQQSERARDILPAELLRPLQFHVDGSAMVNEQLDAPRPSDDNCAVWIPARLATADEIYSFHDRGPYREFVETGAALTAVKSDVYCNPDTSSTAARLSVGAVTDAGATVLRGVEAARRCSTLPRTQNSLVAFCLVRPPGHHCTASQPSGFCLLNNVAVATAQLRLCRSASLPSEVPRVAILDLDVHFGEGSASFVESVADPQTLLYLSLHRHDQGKFYPFDSRGDSGYVGGEVGGHSSKGCICNVAVHTKAHNPSACEQVISDHVFNEVLEKVFLPRLQRFCPDIVFVSLGFDAAYGDPLGKMAVEGGFASVVSRLKRWCTQEDRVSGLVVVLEGGYNPASVAQGILSVGLALSLPQADPVVQARTQERTPRVWSDLRQRQERQLREWQLTQKERAEESTKCAMSSGALDDALTDALRPEQVLDDAALLGRHKEWCACMIDKVRQLHAAALERDDSPPES